MAPGCEPLAVRRMMDVLAPHVHGQSLAGAGGGGFLYLLTKEPQQKEALEAVLAKTEVLMGLGLIRRPLGARNLTVAHQLTRGYICKSPGPAGSVQPPEGLRFVQSLLNTSRPVQGLGNYSIHLVEVDTQGLSLKLLGTEASTCCPFP